MRKILLGGLAALLLVSGAHAEPSARQRELAGRYMRAVKLTEQMNGIMKAMMPGLVQNAARDQTLTDQEKEVVLDTAQEVMAELIPKMIAEFETVVAEVFTEEELVQAAAFYEGPVGRSIVGKSEQLTAKFMPRMEPFSEAAKELMKRRVYERLCPAGRCEETPKRGA